MTAPISQGPAMVAVYEAIHAGVLAIGARNRAKHAPADQDAKSRADHAHQALTDRLNAAIPLFSAFLTDKLGTCDQRTADEALAQLVGWSALAMVEMRVKEMRPAFYRNGGAPPRGRRS